MLASVTRDIAIVHGKRIPCRLAGQSPDARRQPSAGALLKRKCCPLHRQLNPGLDGVTDDWHQLIEGICGVNIDVLFNKAGKSLAIRGRAFASRLLTVEEERLYCSG
jgi:hypothetical protein